MAEKLKDTEAQNGDLVSRNGALAKREQDRILELRMVEQDLNELRTKVKTGADTVDGLRSTKDQMSSQMNQMITEKAQLKSEKELLAESLSVYKKQLEAVEGEKQDLEERF